MRTILDYCAMPPRPSQVEILSEIEEHWDNTDVFVILAPVATGKSLVADTIAQWEKAKGRGATIITPDNALVRQYLDKHKLYTVGVSRSYPTPALYQLAKSKLRGEACVLNYHSYIGNRPFSYNNTLIVDEAHHLIDHLRSTTKLWKHLYNIPPDLYTTSDLMAWLEGDHPRLDAKKRKVIDQIKNLLSGAPYRYIVEDSVEPYRGQERELLKIIDLIPRDNPPIYWPNRINKIVLMSATFSTEDLYDLGLDRRRVHIIDVDSPIPHENRPIFTRPIADMSYKNMHNGAAAAAKWATDMADLRKGEKGLLHTTYSMSAQMQKHLKDDPRFIFHNRWNKQQKLNMWLEAPPETGLIFVGCGVTTGISLDNDRARWQAIVNLPFANVRDRAIRALIEHRPESYYWRTVRHVLQASGRTTRSAEDWSDTFILDSRFPKLYSEHRHMFPKWWVESYKGVYR